VSAARRRWAIAVAAVVVVGTAAIGLSALPDEYTCPSFAVRGGKVESVDMRNVTCAAARGVVQTAHRGSPLRGGTVIVHGWRCSSAGGLTSCTRARAWIHARYVLR
jgi:hypothetical protein